METFDEFNVKIKARLAEKVTGTLKSTVRIIRGLVSWYYGTFGNASKPKLKDLNSKMKSNILVWWLNSQLKQLKLINYTKN